jgi:hypothetical protein
MTPDKMHERLLGIPPTTAQISLYLHGQARGWRDGCPNPERLLGVFMLALHQSLPVDGQSFQRTFLILPQAQEPWATERIRALVRHVLSRHASTPPVYNLVCRAVGSVWFATRALQMDEPARWSAFGFGPDCPVPSWLQTRLLV